MPTQQAPNRGYVDDQRVDNWDSPSLATDAADPFVAPVQISGIDVSRYAYIAGYDRVFNGDASVQWYWTMDQAGAVFVGKRTFTLTSSIPNNAQYRLPNLGPWLTVTWTKLSGAGTQHSAQLIGTNRSHPLEFLPMNPVLIQRNAIAVGAGATDTVYPSDYYAGPVDVYFAPPGATWLLGIDYLSTGGAWLTTYASPTTTANGQFQYKTVTPPGAWRLRVLNLSAAAGNYDLSIRQPQTGST